MARQFYLPPVPSSGDDPTFAAWAQVVTIVLDNLPQFSVGSGDPNSQVTADPGAVFAQNDSSATSVIWVKQTTSGNTGWIAIV